MKYAHTDSNNFILGWYTSDLHKKIPTPNVEITDAAWNSAINNGHNYISSDGVTSYVDPRTQSQKEDETRALRNLLLKEEVDPLVTNPLRWNDLSSDKQAEWTNYRTLLLDVPGQSGFPSNVTWPTKPE